MTAPDVAPPLARLDAVEARLAPLAEGPLPPALTDPDPNSEERWEPAQVWAHISELIPYWLHEAQRIVAEYDGAPVPYGRLATDDIRIDAIEERRAWPQGVRWARIRSGLAEVREWASGLPAAALEAEGRHPTGAVRSVRHVLERSIVAHLEEHADQLERLAGAAAGSAPDAPEERS